jgi:uncharacterized membrane protein YtjA (UPF0391 family)
VDTASVLSAAVAEKTHRRSPEGGVASDIGRRGDMLWTLIVLLLVFWVLGFAFEVAGGIIHVLLVIALVLFLVNLVTGRRTVP